MSLGSPAKRVVCLAALLLISLTSRAQEAPAGGGAAAHKASELRIGSGDLLAVEVYGVPELKQEVRVNSGGEVYLPLVGAAKLSGMTAEEAGRHVAALYREGKYLVEPNVSVFVKEYATQGISVMGEVSKPGIYPMLGARRLYDVLAAAGGTTPKAGRKITITRRDQPDSPVIVSLHTDPQQSAEANVEVFPGDTVMVSKAGIVYVVGEVAKPGGFVMDNNENLTVLQAIALAQGTTRTASLKKARLIRKDASGNLQEVPVPLKEIMAAKAPDIALKNDDIVFVPASAGKNAARRGLEAVLQTVTGVVIYSSVN